MRQTAIFANCLNIFVILSEAKNLSLIFTPEKKERFFASLRMTK